MSREEFEAEWGRCSPWIAAALKEAPPTHTLDDVKAELLAGNAKLWLGQKCAVVTQVETFPRCKAFTVWLAGGDMAEMISELLPKGEAEARELGCRFIAATGRIGWARALGWTPMHWTCAKELT